MKKTIEKVIDYFIGTEGCEFYNKEKQWYSEKIKDKKELEQRLHEISSDKASYFILGKVVPNMIDAITLGYMAISKEVFWPCVAICFGEGRRYEASKTLTFDRLDYAYKQHSYLSRELSKPENVEKLAEMLKENMSKEELEKLRIEMGGVIKESKELLENHDCEKCGK